MPQSTIFVPGARLALLPFVSLCLQHAAGYGVPGHATVVSRQEAAVTAYDFVIAGGGIGGLTMANRLSEDPNVNVLVIEAGPLLEDEGDILIPGATENNDFNNIKWYTPTVPQAAQLNQTFNDNNAKVVGGSSAVAAMTYMRGHVGDFHSWTAVGNEGWTFDDLLPYYIQAETFEPPTPEFLASISGGAVFDAAVHGTDGPVKISYPAFIYEGGNAFYNACIEAGITEAADTAGGQNQGVFALTLNIDPSTRQRSYARSAHYAPAATRPNFHLMANTTVDKVVFEGTRAVGVAFVASAGTGEAGNVTATKEVILSAAALHTPPILQRSGVGPAALLEGLGIPVVADLPGVGQNLQLQGICFVPLNVTNNFVPNVESLRLPDFASAALDEYQTSKTGPLVAPGYIGHSFALVPLKNLTADYEAIIDAARAGFDAALSLPANTDPTVLAGYMAAREQLLEQFAGDVPVAGLHYGTGSFGYIYIQKPLSRGSVAIASTDPLAEPTVDYRTLTDPVDIAVGTAAFRAFRSILAQPSLSALGPVEQAPWGAQVTTDEQIADALRAAYVPSNGHSFGTSPMLPRELGGVLDSELRVYGTAGLRVVDVSFHPIALGGLPQSSIYATGEKIAAVIKAQYALK